MIIFKIPFGSGGLGKTAGTISAPDAILKAVKNISSTEKGGYFKIDEKQIEIDNNNIENSLNQITHQITNLPFIALGGDHTITYSIIKKIANENLGIVIFDAHPDLMQKFSIPTHENYLRHLIEENIIKSNQIVLVSLRSIDVEEKKFLDEKKINYFTMHEIMQEGIQHICDSIMASMKDFNQMYISIDIDAIDPAFAPGTGNPEPAGLSSSELLYCLRRLMMMQNYSGGDIVEINPEKDLQEKTVKLGARILVEMMGKS